MRRIKRNALLLATALIGLASCREGIIYHQYREINKEFWGKEEAIYFTFRIDDTTTACDILLEVRNDNLYPYQNLWVFCSETSPATSVTQDTLECILADEFGKWHGKGIVLHQMSFPIRTGHTFPARGEYTFAVRHAMRTGHLRGIRNIGLCVKQARQ